MRKSVARLGIKGRFWDGGDLLIEFFAIMRNPNYYKAPVTLVYLA